MEWRRLCIDSRFRTKDSLSNSDFYVELPYPTSVPRGTVMYVDGVCLSHSWSTVIENVNDKLYVLESVAGGTDHERVVHLTEGRYNASTLVQEIHAKLNSGTNLAGAYTVVESDGRLTIGNLSDELTEGKAWVYSKEQTDGPYLKVVYPVYPGASASELIGHIVTPSLPGGWIHSGHSLLCSYMDLQHHKQIFIHAPGLGESSTMNLSSNTDIIRRVLLGGSAQGDIVNDVLQTGLSSVTFGSDTVLKRMHFQIKGWDGILIGMGNHQISWEIILQRPDEK